MAGGSWTSAVESLDNYARAVLPNSCSVNGSNGFTGCLQQALQTWHTECRGIRHQTLNFDHWHLVPFPKLSTFHPPFYPALFHFSHAA